LDNGVSRQKPYRYELKELTLEITNACPLKCKHCSSVAGHPLKDELTLMQCKNIVDDFVSLGGNILEISGGEPFSSPNIFALIEYAKEKNLKVYIYTCGVLGTHSEPVPIDNSVAEKMANLKVDRFFVNLQAASPQVHERITGVEGSFKVTTDSIATLIKYDFYVGIHAVPMKPNFKEVLSLVDFATHLGVQEVALLQFVPQGRGSFNRQELELSPGEFKELFTMAYDVKFRYSQRINVRMGAPINFCFLLNNSQVPRCTAGMDKCLISADGKVFPCPAFKQNTGFIAGSIKENSLVDIWKKSPILWQFRKFNPENLVGHCKACSYLNECKGRCAAQRVIAHGDLYHGPVRYCFIHIEGRKE